MIHHLRTVLMNADVNYLHVASTVQNEKCTLGGINFRV